MNQVDSLAQRVRAPAPREAHKPKNKNEKKSTGKGKKQVKRKSQGKKGKTKPEVPKTDQEQGSEWQAVLEDYNPAKHPGVDPKVILKRAHSKVWHSEYQKFKTTMDEAAAKKLASISAQKLAARFRATYQG